jgi:hypothetical protein
MDYTYVFSNFRILFLDILPTLGTKSSVSYIKSLLMANDSNIGDHVTTLLSTMAVSTMPDITGVDVIRVSQ